LSSIFYALWRAKFRKAEKISADFLARRVTIGRPSALAERDYSFAMIMGDGL
jgi:hypothetical protein